ncbi:MAG: nitroreductase family protein [Bacteroidales bacterium]|nr:nitroreductase family protein [Bacteroidales bacterium]
MADNYLERRQEEVAAGSKKKVIRNHPSLDTLLHRNRSYRGFLSDRIVTEEELKKIVATTTLVASGMNRQVLRYKLVTQEANQVLPLITLGGALPQEHLPKPGTEPSAYIVVCSTIAEDRVVDMDLGIAAQSMLLKATEMGLGGVFILNFRREALKEALNLPLEPLAVLAIGQPAENIYLLPGEEGHLAYYRKNGVHFVPKLPLDTVLL